jgi:hypothetical protein
MSLDVAVKTLRDGEDSMPIAETLPGKIEE